MTHRMMIQRSTIRRLRHITLLVAAVLALVLATPEPARACSCIMYDPGFLISDGGRLPADARGVPWSGWGQVADRVFEPSSGGTFQVVRLGPQGEQALEVLVERIEGPEGWSSGRGIATVLVRPKDGFEEGATYRLTYGGRTDFFRRHPRRGDNAQTIEVTVGRTRLGEASTDGAVVAVVATDREEIHVAAGASCSTSYEAGWVDVRLELPPAFEPWRENLLYVTHVDGKVWQPSGSLCTVVPEGRSWGDVGGHRLFTSCASERVRYGQHQPLDAGPREVRMTAFLPGTDLVIEAVAEIEMECESKGLLSLLGL